MIRLYNLPTEQAPSLKLAPDNLQRPTADTRAIQRGTRELGQANQQSEVDPSSFVEAAGAMGQIGRALMQTGDVISALAKKKSDADNRNAMNLAQSEYETANAEIAAFAEDPHNDEAAVRKYATERQQLAVKAAGKIPGFNREGKQWLDTYAQTSSRKTEVGIGTYLAKKSFRKAADSTESLLFRAADSRNWAEVERLKKQGADEGYFDEGRVYQIDSKISSMKLGDVQNRMTYAAMTDNQAEIDRAAVEAMKIPGVTETQVNIAQEEAKRDAAQGKAIAENKVRAATYEDLNSRIASGKPPTRAEVEAMRERKEIDTAQYRNLTSQVGVADPAAWESFLSNDVTSFGSTPDPTGAQWATLQQKAFGMGPSQIQMQRFQGLLTAAQERNGTEEGRAESYVRKFGMEHINTMLKDGAFGRWETTTAGLDKALTAHISDPVKMSKLLGVAVTGKNVWDEMNIAEQIAWKATRDPQTAFEMFRKTAKVSEKDSGLDPATYARLIHAGERRIDRAAMMKAAGTAAQLQDQFAVAYKDFTTMHKRLPNGSETRAMIGEITRPFTDKSTWTPFKPPAPPVRVVKPDKVSIRGFEAAPALSTKLPAALAPYAGDFADAAQKYDLDPYVLAAIAMHETGGGSSKAFREKKNAMGTSDRSGPRTFASVRESIMHQAEVLAMQNGPYAGKRTLAEIGAVYAPADADNDPRNLNRFWQTGVAEYYDQLRR